jgi:hypothetical protein
MKAFTNVLTSAVLATTLLAAAQGTSQPNGANRRYGSAATANYASANNDSQSDQKQTKSAKPGKKQKKAEPQMQPNDSRKSPWTEPRDWNYISNL